MTENKSKELSIEFLHQLANDLMFELSDEQCHNLWLEFDAIEKQMQQVTKIDTINTLPLDYPFEYYQSFLREDEVQPSLKVAEVLNNASRVKNDFIVINRVVNNEN